MIHDGSPSGVPRAMLWRTAASSASLCTAATWSSQSRGRWNHAGSFHPPAPPAAQRCRLDHRQFSACRTRPARSGLRSTYRTTFQIESPFSIIPAARSSAEGRRCWIGKLLNRPCHTCPLLA
ncbi:MAG: hypothetical protein ABFD92_12640 [Planctomycetaceae bacterium]|nr:hypothetical protein [Planctomycetaceae bacterium]